MFIESFIKIAAGFDQNKAKAISSSFNSAMGMSGVQKGWSNLKKAFGGPTPPAPKPAPANVSAARPPMPS